MKTFDLLAPGPQLNRRALSVSVPPPFESINGTQRAQAFSALLIAAAHDLRRGRIVVGTAANRPRHAQVLPFKAGNQRR